MREAWQVTNVIVPYIIRQMPSWLCLKTDVHFPEVPHYLVILMTVCNHSVPLSIEGKTSQVIEIYIIMQ